MSIITHTSPDWDAIGSAWLLKRYDEHYTHAEIICASREEIEEEAKTPRNAIVDCGGVYHPMHRRFDHHQLTGKEANETCAMYQVWEWLNGDGKLDHLAPLVLLIWAGDTGRNEHGADVSREVGLHAQLSARKADGWSDNDLTVWGCQELDFLADLLKRQADARKELAERCVWSSVDGKIVAILNGDPCHSQAAYAAGATLVVFRSDIPVADGTSHAIGVSRNQAADFPHIGDLLSASEIDADTKEDNWYRHPAGFMAGRGTSKAQRFDAVPDTLTVEAVARAIDAAWER